MNDSTDQKRRVESIGIERVLRVFVIYFYAIDDGSNRFQILGVNKIHF